MDSEEVHVKELKDTKENLEKINSLLFKLDEVDQDYGKIKDNILELIAKIANNEFTGYIASLTIKVEIHGRLGSSYMNFILIDKKTSNRSRRGRRSSKKNDDAKVVSFATFDKEGILSDNLPEPYVDPQDYSLRFDPYRIFVGKLLEIIKTELKFAPEGVGAKKAQEEFNLLAGNEPEMEFNFFGSRGRKRSKKRTRNKIKEEKTRKRK